VVGEATQPLLVTPACVRGVVAAFGIILAIFFDPRAVNASDPTVDLELVLAVDVSGSVDDAEFALQMAGIAEAFRDPQVRAAIASGPRGRIAVSLVLWADAQGGRMATPWRIIESEADAESFARSVEGQPRGVPPGSTGIGPALHFSLRHIQGNDIVSARQVIDLSGDGRETAPREYVVLLWQGRAAARASGVTVNGLAILADEPDLDRYFRDELITGPDAFVEAASGYLDFAAAMRRKLLREIKTHPAVSYGREEGQRSGRRPI